VEFDEFKAKVQKAGKAKIGGVVVDNPSEDQLLEGASSFPFPSFAVPIFVPPPLLYLFRSYISISTSVCLSFIYLSVHICTVCLSFIYLSIHICTVFPPSASSSVYHSLF
jgi:hypothetical protein